MRFLYKNFSFLDKANDLPINFIEPHASASAALEQFTNYLFFTLVVTGIIFCLLVFKIFNTFCGHRNSEKKFVFHSSLREIVFLLF